MFWKLEKKPNGTNGHKGSDEVVASNSSLIKFDSVSKIYKTSAGEFTALKDVDLEISQGELVSIVGKSGSGKTTLINMLTGIDKPTAGTISVDGTLVQSLNEGERAIWRGKNIGIVFQFFQLLPTLTLLENVRLPMDFGDVLNQEERQERALELLAMVGLPDQANTLPARLSGGQQQRAAIARALANNPPIIATDEPTGNLDSKSAEQVITLFEDLVQEGKTILMVTHDDDLASRAPRIIRLSDGKILKETG